MKRFPHFPDYIYREAKNPKDRQHILPARIHGMQDGWKKGQDASYQPAENHHKNFLISPRAVILPEAAFGISRFEDFRKFFVFF